jgi:hypothetical protein
MKTSASRKHSATPSPAFLAEVFQARCEARAILVGALYLELQEAVDGLQAAAIAYGLVDATGQDAVQAVMAAAFAKVPPADLAEALEMLPQPRSDGAAGATVEALLFSMRERGKAALAKPDCRRRLADLSTAQVRRVIARLMRLRPRYPAVTDELLFLLGEQLR